MAKAAIKVKRAGCGRRIVRLVKFRDWLNKQPRKDLTYTRDIPRSSDAGWTTEDFVLEARQRGVEARIMTAYKWCAGAQPRVMTRSQLDRAFVGIEF